MTSSSSPSNTRISSSNETVKQHLKDSEIGAAKEVEDAVNKYLRRTSETYDLSKHYQVNRFTQALTATILLLFVLLNLHYSIILTHPETLGRMRAIVGYVIRLSKLKNVQWTPEVHRELR